jgi:histidinol-phosphate/aromatic aminotransferase/cobyric acid decarboxylase-like protein
MSKVYALSGVRAAYLCGPAQMVGQLRPLCPPWSVSLPSQIAACEALRTLDYYRARWQETHALREALRRGLEQLGWDVVAGCANFLLCHLPVNGPDAATVAARTRRRGLFVRDVGNMGTALGARALRIAVKDGRSNSRILEILRATVAEAT